MADASATGDGMQAQVAGDYSAALRAYAESLKLEEDPPRDTTRGGWVSRSSPSKTGDF